jgi:hypothetical protein
MRRVRASTWILTAVFLITLTTYLLIRPPLAATAVLDILTTEA